MSRCWLFMMLALVIVLAGCGGEDKEQPTPTSSPSPTPLTPTSLPPTWTPSPPGFVASPTLTLVPTERPVDTTSGQGGQSLPATWTPGPGRPTLTPWRTPTNTPEPGLITPTVTEVQPTSSLPEECFELNALQSDQEIMVGEPVAISWTPVPGLGHYLVELYDGLGVLVLSEIVRDTTFALPGELFSRPGVYGWEVTPVFEDGERTCFGIAGEIIVSETVILDENAAG